MRTTITLQPADRTQMTALFAALVAAGVGGPDADEGLRVAYDPETGLVTIDADRDVRDLLAGWTPPPPAVDAFAAALDGATTLAQLRTVLKTHFAADRAPLRATAHDPLAP